ncbi:MAG: NAD(P)H-dependent oxidoreductase [Capnocytophaga sp.]|nr:NAD(P)H-dependent oxidoreductase [Capnocytophaga sp.]
MKKVLMLNASVRNEKSQSRKLSQLFENQWKEKFPDDVFTHREVGTAIIPHIGEPWIAAAFIKPENRTEENQKALVLSNKLVDELKENDIYVLATPMYNWSIPSGLKAYIDQIMRINETWKFRSGTPDGDYVGLLTHKKMFLLSSRGDTGYGKHEKNAHMNFQTTYLSFIFRMMGVTDITVISLDNEEFGGDLFANSQKQAFKQVVEVITQ